MNNNIEKRLKQINIENNIWIIYLIIIGLSFYSNKLEKDYFINKNNISKETYRKINTIIFIVLILVYSYFEEDAIESFFNNQNKTSKQKKYDSLILIASTAILISGFIFLYIILDDKNLDTEIAYILLYNSK